MTPLTPHFYHRISIDCIASACERVRRSQQNNFSVKRKSGRRVRSVHPDSGSRISRNFMSIVGGRGRSSRSGLGGREGICAFSSARSPSQVMLTQLYVFRKEWRAYASWEVSVFLQSDLSVPRAHVGFLRTVNERSRSFGSPFLSQQNDNIGKPIC